MFLHEYEVEKTIVMYHAISQELMYGKPLLSSILHAFDSKKTIAEALGSFSHADRAEVRRTIQLLVKKSFLVEDAGQDLILIADLQAKMPAGPEFSTLYLVLTEECNFDCKYCFIKDGKTECTRARKERMTLEVAKQGIDLFLKNAHPGQCNIVFYGGEPLGNREILKYAIEYLKERKRELPDLTLEITTNGSLITEDMARYLSDNGVVVAVSIDGPQKIHDSVRIDKLGNGTFDRVIEGYMLSKKAGCTTGISCTIGEHNIDVLEELTEYFVADLEVDFLDFNLVDLAGGDWQDTLNAEYVAEKLIRAYETALAAGIEVGVIGRKVAAFVEKEFRFFDCAGCGREIVVRPDGQVGPCHGFFGTDQFFSQARGRDLKKDPTFVEWARRSPVSMDLCLRCEAIAICGGGCPHNAYIYTGNIQSVDNVNCIINKRVLAWVLKSILRSKKT